MAMRKKYKCIQCGKRNEFDTDRVKREVRLRESYAPDVEDNEMAYYVVECSFCHAKNKILI
jgi:DNA-directed RNA polymerase subunit RPC12/RpoP